MSKLHTPLQTSLLVFKKPNYSKKRSIYSAIQYNIKHLLFASSSKGRNGDRNDLRVAVANADGSRLNTRLLCRCFGITVELDIC